jgi:hypothetical protein
MYRERLLELEPILYAQVIASQNTAEQTSRRVVGADYLEMV